MKVRAAQWSSFVASRCSQADPIAEQAVDPVDRPRRDAELSIRFTRPPISVSRSTPGWSDMNRLVK
jgi:hypothetical protein